MRKVIVLPAVILALALSSTPAVAQTQYQATQDFLDVLDEQGYQYVLGGLSPSTQAENVKIGFTGSNKDEIMLECYFYPDNGCASLYCWDLIDFNESKAGEVILVCNSLNLQYPYVKYAVDLQENSVTVRADWKMDPDSDCGRISLSALVHSVMLIDQSYTELASFQETLVTHYLSDLLP